MKKTVLMIVLVLVLTCTSVFAFGPISTNLTNTWDPSIVNVNTSASLSGGVWTWIYDVTPGVASTDISIFRLNVGKTAANSIFNVTGPFNTATSTSVPGWNYYGLNKGYIQWTDILSANNISAGNTYRFSFDTRYGPVSEIFASALGEKGYTGNVPGPSTVPEPGSLLALTSFLAAGAGFMRIKNK